MKKYLLLSGMSLLCVFNADGQQLGTGVSTLKSNMNSPLLSGFYYNQNQDDFQGQECDYLSYLLSIRGETSAKNYQMQIASSFVENDKLFFRKIKKDNLTNGTSEWYEFATRKNNTYNGNQIINGNMVINGAQTINGKVNIADNQMITVGGTSIADNRLRIYYERNWLQTFVDYYPELLIRTHNKPVMKFTSDERVGIGYYAPRCKLDVNGAIRARELRIEASESAWPDFVFSDSYELLTLNDIDKYIMEHKHLPGIPKEKEVIEEGINVGELQIKLLQKIEELTIYAIEQQKTIEKLENRINLLESK